MSFGKLIKVSKTQLSSRVGGMIIPLIDAIDTEDQGHGVETDTEIIPDQQQDQHIQETDILGQGQGIDTIKRRNIKDQRTPGQGHAQNLDIIQEQLALQDPGQGQQKGSTKDITSQGTIPGQDLGQDLDHTQGQKVEKGIRTLAKEIAHTASHQFQIMCRLAKTKVLRTVPLRIDILAQAPDHDHLVMREKVIKNTRNTSTKRVRTNPNDKMLEQP